MSGPFAPSRSPTATSVKRWFVPGAQAHVGAVEPKSRLRGRCDAERGRRHHGGTEEGHPSHSPDGGRRRIARRSRDTDAGRMSARSVTRQVTFRKRR